MQIVDLPLSLIRIPDVRITSHMPPEIAEQFRSSVQAAGVLEPLLVVREGETYYLVNGLHRLQEAAVRGDATIPSAILDGTLREVLLWNLVTSGLHGRPKASEVRHVVRALEDEYAMDLVALRKATGLTEDYLSKIMWVNRALPRVQGALDEELIALGHAVALARVDNKELQARLLDTLLTHPMRVDMFEQVCKGAAERAAEGVPFVPADAATDGHRDSTDPLCDTCQRPTPVRRLQTLILCPSCFGIAYAAMTATEGPVGSSEGA